MPASPFLECPPFFPNYFWDAPPPPPFLLAFFAWPPPQPLFVQEMYGPLWNLKNTFFRPGKFMECMILDRGKVTEFQFLFSQFDSYCFELKYKTVRQLTGKEILAETSRLTGLSWMMQNDAKSCKNHGIPSTSFCVNEDKTTNVTKRMQEVFHIQFPESKRLVILDVTQLSDSIKLINFSRLWFLFH